MHRIRKAVLIALCLVICSSVLGNGLCMNAIAANKTKSNRDISKRTDKTVYSLPPSSKEDKITVSVQNSSGKTYYYTIFNQFSGGYGKYDEFIMWHGCAVSSLTTLLASRVPKLANYDPDDTIRKIENKVFAKSIVKRNYKKKLKLQRPVSLYGITRILKKYKIKYKHVYRYSKKTAEKEITAHLKKGNPVLVTVKKGKWASTYHTMLLIGLDAKGRAIIADSANRKWAGKHQRIKYAKVSELLKSMWSGRCSTSVYWNGYNGCGGYILVY